MKLVRLAFFQLKGVPSDLRGNVLKAADLSVGPPGVTVTENLFLLPSTVGLAHRPKRTRDGLIVLPDRPRTRAEEGIEHFVNLLSVSLGISVSISSSSP